MQLNEFKALLEANRDKAFRLQLPDQSAVPVSFHITEVALMHKTFIDCGGTLRESRTCQLQAWVGPDDDHRIASHRARWPIFLVWPRSFCPTKICRSKSNTRSWLFRNIR